MVWEYYNTGKGASAASTIYNGAIAYMQTRRTAGVAKLFFGSSVDSTDSAAGYTESIRQAYNTWCDQNAAAYCDVYVPLHNDPSMASRRRVPTPRPTRPTSTPTAST